VHSAHAVDTVCHVSAVLLIFSPLIDGTWYPRLILCLVPLTLPVFLLFPPQLKRGEISEAVAAKVIATHRPVYVGAYPPNRCGCAGCLCATCAYMLLMQPEPYMVRLCGGEPLAFVLQKKGKHARAGVGLGLAPRLRAFALEVRCKMSLL
jgi:hypothetical protein